MHGAELTRLSWPSERLKEAIAALGIHSKLLDALQDSESFTVFATSLSPQQAERDAAIYVEEIAARLGLDAEAVEIHYDDVATTLPFVLPALVRIHTSSGARFLLVVARRRKRLIVLDSDLNRAPLSLETVRLALCSNLEATQAEVIENLLNETGVQGHRRERARASLLKEFLANHRIQVGWILRPTNEAPIKRQSHSYRLGSPLTIVVLAYGIAFFLWLCSWWLIGQSFVSGYLDSGWLIAWGLMLLTLIPFKLLASYAGGLFSVRAGAFLKRRLLFGVLRLEPDEIRHQGIGQFLGDAMEVETIEQMAITGGFLGITALVELALSGQIIGAGIGGGWQMLIFGFWLVMSLLLGSYYLYQRRRWTAARLGLTHDLVEGMVGQRTRAVQAPKESTIEEEDQALEYYHSVCLGLDRTALYLQILIPRGWFISGMAGLTPHFISGTTLPTEFAISLGGLLLAYHAFRYLSEGLERLIAAWVGWETIRPVWQAAARPVCRGDMGLSSRSMNADASTSSATDRQTESDQEAGKTPIIDCHNLVFRHTERVDPVLRNLNFKVFSGEKILLQGPSGSGKSTLGMLLAGQQKPNSGLCLLHGLDRISLGDAAWRQQVGIVPQFHENHIFIGTVAFNLLMGRAWPPTQSDLAEAESVCHALGLGQLLERMPSGLQQWLGETGWQLSHGERDRICIGRALLQGAELLILDESFSALDARTLSIAMQAVLNHTQALIVIAHT